MAAMVFAGLIILLAGFMVGYLVGLKEDLWKKRTLIMELDRDWETTIAAIKPPLYY